MRVFRPPEAAISVSPQGLIESNESSHTRDLRRAPGNFTASATRRWILSAIALQRVGYRFTCIQQWCFVCKLA